MLNWLKFFPFEYRADHKPKEVQGPYFPALKPNKWFLTDSLITFTAPKANPIFGFSGRSSSVDAVSPGSANILKAQCERLYGKASGAPASQWDHSLFYSNTWYFVGPWFTGFQANLTATGLLIKARDGEAFADQNLFHPRVFESAVANYLDSKYGYDKNGSKQKFRGPLNWRVLPVSSSIQAVVFDIHDIGNTNRDNPLLRRQLFFPVTPQQMIGVNFNFGGTEINRDEVCAKPLFTLCDSIIESFRIKVGAHTQAEWDKVKATCPDMAITPNFGELPWPLKVEKSQKKPNEVDITPAQDTLTHKGL